MKNSKIKKFISINLILISILSIFNFNSKSKATITRENETGEITSRRVDKTKLSWIFRHKRIL